MKKHKSLHKFVLLLTMLVTLYVTLASLTEADDLIENYDAVQAQLPDSVSLRNKVVYIDFWATWCPPCRKSFPWMQRLHEKFGDDGLEIVAVNLDKDSRSVAKFLKEIEPSFRVIFDSVGALAKLYELEAVPTSFLFGRDGHLVARHEGFHEEKTDSIAQTIQELLKVEAPK